MKFKFSQPICFISKNEKTKNIKTRKERHRTFWKIYPTIEKNERVGCWRRWAIDRHDEYNRCLVVYKVGCTTSLRIGRYELPDRERCSFYWLNCIHESDGYPLPSSIAMDGCSDRAIYFTLARCFWFNVFVRDRAVRLLAASPPPASTSAATAPIPKAVPPPPPPSPR